MEKIPELIKKHGATGVLVVWLWFMNGRLTEVERRLYDCYERTTLKSYNESKEPLAPELFAILPEKIKIIYKS